MIINASGRTDVVAYYMDWFVNRWNEGYFDVRNPFNPKLVSRIYVSDIDMIVFCTKNPLPLLDTSIFCTYSATSYYHWIF